MITPQDLIASNGHLRSALGVALRERDEARVECRLLRETIARLELDSTRHPTPLPCSPSEADCTVLHRPDV